MVKVFHAKSTEPLYYRKTKRERRKEEKRKSNRDWTEVLVKQPPPFQSILLTSTESVVCCHGLMA